MSIRYSSHPRIMSSVRRSPFFFLVDSAAGGGYAEGFRTLFRELLDRMRANPYFLETAHLSVVKFTGEAKVVMPLVDICSINAGSLGLDRGSGLGHGFSLLADTMRSNLVITKQGVAGDWKPVVIAWIVADPTDDYVKGLESLESVKIGKRFAFVSKAVSKSVMNRLKDSFFKVVSEESSPDDVVAWLESILDSGNVEADCFVDPPDESAGRNGPG